MDQLLEEFQKFKEIIEEKDKQIELLNKRNSETTYNISIINYIQQNFANAPPIKQIDDMDIMTERLENIHHLTMLNKDISQGLISYDVVRYIAPYFSFDKSEELI